MATLPLDEITRDRVAALVAAGAELESRDVAGELQRHAAVSRTTFRWSVEDDGSVVVMLMRVPPPLGTLEDGTAVYDQGAQPAGVPAVRLDELANGAVGLQHPDGGYSVLRPVTGDRVAELAAWDTGIFD